MRRKSEGPTVMVVDDYDDTRWLMRCWLERKGYRVVEAGDGAEAVDKAVLDPPDLILMDIEMPRLDGLSATRRLRGQGGFGSVPIIAVSAYGAEEFRQTALDAGCDEYVVSPFTPEEMEEMIGRVLSEARPPALASGPVPA